MGVNIKAPATHWNLGNVWTCCTWISGLTILQSTRFYLRVLKLDIIHTGTKLYTYLDILWYFGTESCWEWSLATVFQVLWSASSRLWGTVEATSSFHDVSKTHNWRFPEMGVPPKTSILIIGLSIGNPPTMGVPPFLETHNWWYYGWRQKKKTPINLFDTM